jgi:hypothetical protein
MRVIPLSGGKFVAVVSEEDYRRVNKYSWHVHFSAGTKKKHGQPYARARVDGKKTYLHRFIVTNVDEWLQVDHINRCTLDCRRENLEVVTHVENVKRRRPRK